jgi:phosphopantetheine--protein transferase-like protein
MKGKRESPKLEQAGVEAALSAAIRWIEGPGPDMRLAVLTAPAGVPADALTRLVAAEEVAKGQALPSPEERQHLYVRRAFQRLFVAKVVGWNGPLAGLPLVHALDQRSVCPLAPQVTLSFSSSQGFYCACASGENELGIDVERRRSVDNVLDLAGRFFAPEEAAAIAASPLEARSEMFLHMWTAKEAGLKALGLGIVDGLNRFVVVRDERSYRLANPNVDVEFTHWHLNHVSADRDHVLAVVHRAKA